MSVTVEIASVPAPNTKKPSFGEKIKAGIGAAFGAIGAGWRGAADYHELSELSDRQLKLRGLARSDIPQELHQRHFASLSGWLSNID